MEATDFQPGGQRLSSGDRQVGQAPRSPHHRRDRALSPILRSLLYPVLHFASSTRRSSETLPSFVPRSPASRRLTLGLALPIRPATGVRREPPRAALVDILRPQRHARTPSNYSLRRCLALALRLRGAMPTNFRNFLYMFITT